MLQIALLQLKSNGTDQDANLTKGDAFCRKAAQAGADIALFPEMWNIGYTAYHREVWDMDYDPLNPWYPELRDQWKRRAVSRDSGFVTHFSELARELDMAVAITYLEEHPEAPRNSMTLFNHRGDHVMTYAKVHTCDFSLEAACTPGEGFYVKTLQTRQGDVKLGAMICYDTEFPESARVLMLEGAEVILVPTSTHLDDHRTSQLRVRSLENMVGVAAANYAETNGSVMGHSVAYDGMAYTKDERWRDPLVVRAGTAEGIYMARFDLDALRDYRGREAWGNAFRKPSRYGPLVSEQVSEPFIRKSARR